MVGILQAILLRDRLQVLSNIFLEASHANDGINNVSGGTSKDTLDVKLAKKERQTVSL
jgi:hypothetical protein